MNVKQFENLYKQTENLEDSWHQGKITQKEYERKSNLLDKKLTSAINFKKFNSKKEFIEESRKLAKEYAKKFNAPEFIKIVEHEIEHELEHAQVNKKYRLPTTFGFFFWEIHGSYQPLVLIEELSKLTKKWSKYKRFKYDIESLTFPKDPSPMDIKSLKRLKKRIKYNEDLSNSEKELLIRFIERN